MLNESTPTASARTASSTVLRITTSPRSSRPDSSTLMGTNESKPNSMSWVVIWCPFSSVKPGNVKKFRVIGCRVRSGGHRRRESEELAESIDHQIPALHLGNGLAPDDLVLSGKLPRSAGRSDRHGDGNTHGLIVGEVGSPLGEGVDVVCHRGSLTPREARHLCVGGRDVPNSENS